MNYSTSRFKRKIAIVSLVALESLLSLPQAFSMEIEEIDKDLRSNTKITSNRGKYLSYIDPCYVGICFEAFNHLGRMHLEGNGVDKDEKKAFELFKFSAKHKDPNGTFYLGLCYQEGKGVKTNKTKAMLHFANTIPLYYHVFNKKDPADPKLVQAKDQLEKIKKYLESSPPYEPSVQCVWGLLYNNGDGVKQDTKKAMHYFELAASQGNVIAQCHLGSTYLLGTNNIKQNNKGAIKHLESAANKGHATAQCNLGSIYMQERDYEKAFKYFKLSSDQGYEIAQFNLAQMYVDGTGVKKDLKETFKYFTLSANQGCARAQYSLAQMYYIEADYKKALIYFELAADQGEAGAQSDLGEMYRNGIGTDPDYKEAFKYYKLSADQGHEIAQFNMGMVYLNGCGVVKQDLKEAFKYIKLSADQGHKPAQSNLAQMYRTGTGTKKDLREASKYENLAKNPGL